MTKETKAKKVGAETARAKAEADLADVARRLSRLTPRPGYRGVAWPMVQRPQDAQVLSLHAQLLRTQWLPPERIAELQRRQAEIVLAHARATVPAYAERLRDFGEFKPGEIDQARWQAIPILDRNDVAALGDELLSTRLPPEHGPVATVHTPGSVGLALTVKTTPLMSAFASAFTLRHHIWHNRDLTGIAGVILPLSPEQQKLSEAARAVPWVPGFGGGKMFFCDIRHPPERQLEWLAALNPKSLLTSPANLAALLARAERSGIKAEALMDVATVGEVVDQDLRETCQRVWGLGIVDAYTVREVGLIAIQCPHAPHYHVQAEGLLVEIVDDEGQACAPGEIGRVVVTTLNNLAMPLIRYAVGDHAEAAPPCPCGRGLPVLKRIVGRGRNAVVLPDGTRVWPRIPHGLIAEVIAAERFQLVQRPDLSLSLDLVLGKDATLSDGKRKTLEAALGKRLLAATGHALSPTVAIVDEIIKTPGERIEQVLSQVDGQ